MLNKLWLVALKFTYLFFSYPAQENIRRKCFFTSGSFPKAGVHSKPATKILIVGNYYQKYLKTNKYINTWLFGFGFTQVLPNCCSWKVGYRLLCQQTSVLPALSKIAAQCFKKKKKHRHEDCIEKRGVQMKLGVMFSLSVKHGVVQNLLYTVYVQNLFVYYTRLAYA